MDADVPEDGLAFEEMMREVDARLIRENRGIPARPWLAIRDISIRYGISIPIAGPSSRLPPELERYAKLGRDIHAWYERQYGNRLSIDPSPGRVVTNIEGDLYVIRPPRFFGTVRLVLDRGFRPRPTLGSEGPVEHNILESVEGLTKAKAAGLSDQVLRSIADEFRGCLEAHGVLEANRQNDLIRIAQGDVEMAVTNLMDRTGRFGESKWSSLQAAEKVLKASIAAQGARFRQTHNLDELFEQLGRLGVSLQHAPFVAAIQCSPAIRYGQQPCTREEAFQAHRASLMLVLELVHAGAKLSSDLKWWLAPN